MSDNAVIVQPTTTILEISDLNGPEGIVQAVVTEVEITTSTAIEVVEVGIAGPSGSEEDTMLAKQVDFVTDYLIYRGEAQPGAATSSAVWRIRRITFEVADDDVMIKWADGNAAYDNVWDDRASLTYS